MLAVAVAALGAFWFLWLSSLISHPGRGAYLKNSVGPYLYRGPGKGFGTISLFKNTGKRRNLIVGLPRG